MSISNQPTNSNQINDTPFSREMRFGFSEYAKYVISDRALPDARDGLKPVHRRILWAMNELGLGPRSSFKKCARIVGETTGRFHPHAGGVYESLVRLGQDWSLRYPLVQPQGNFGSIDGMGPAAMRYTEARLASISTQLMENISTEVVDFIPNFDGEELEPTVLPVKIPQLLLNGSYGIAVGISSNIPPHNLTELMQASIAIIDDIDITNDELMEFVKGPDFPTGGKIIGDNGIAKLYNTGKGSFRIRSKYHLETPETHNVKDSMLVFTEIPYLQAKESLVEGIAALINDDRLRGVTDVRDLSEGSQKIRIEVIIEDQYANEDSMKTVLGQLFKNTSLETAFHCRINAFVYGRPVNLNLKQALCVFLDFRETTIRRIATEELQKVLARLHILEGLITASDHIDEVIDLIRNSDSRSHAQEQLIKVYKLSEDQAKAVLAMTLGRLARMEMNQLETEREERKTRRDELMDIIENRDTLLDLMKEEFMDIIGRYGDDRRSEILEFDNIIQSSERPILHERTLLVTATHEGYIRTIDYSKFRTQGRGGRGVAGVPIQEDRLHDMLVVSNLDDLLLITTEGIVHQIPAFELPEVRSRTSKGSKIIRYQPVDAPVVKVVNVQYDKFDDDRYLVTVTKNGIVKRTQLSNYGNIRRTGIICLSLKEGDEVVDAFISEGNSLIFIASKLGQAALFDEEENVRPTGRTAQGVIGMRVDDEDEVVSAFAVKKSEYETTSILTVTENGYGKRTPLKKYRITNRNVKGVINMKIVDKNGPVVTSMPVPIEAGDSNMSLINSDGILIKVPLKGIRNMGRSTQGVKVMKIEGDQKLVMATSVVDDGEEDQIEEDEEDLAEIEKDMANQDDDPVTEISSEETDEELEIEELEVKDDEYPEIDFEGLEDYLNDDN